MLLHRLPRMISFCAICLLAAFTLIGLGIQQAAADDTVLPTLQFSTYLGGSSGEHGESIALDKDGNIYVTGYTTSDDFPATNPFGVNLSTANIKIYVTKFDPTGTTQLYSIYLGIGQAFDIAVDAGGNAYVVGEASNIPVVGAIQPVNAGGNDVFISKINPSGTALVYSTYLGGSQQDIATGVALDANRNAYIVGATGSTNFPTRTPAQANYGGGQWDNFLMRVNAAGTALVYSTYWGGSDWDISMDVALDAGGNAYLTGDTTSTNFPTVNAYQPALATPCTFPSTPPCRDVTVAKFSPTGAALYSTYFGGTGNSDRGNAITVDGDGNAYITGYTSSPDMPVTPNAFQSSIGSFSPTFVAKFSADGSDLLYSTFLGGTTGSLGMDIKLDAHNNMVVAGVTLDTDFPTVNPIQAVKHGGTSTSDAFITWISADGSSLLFSTYFGGSHDEYTEFSPRMALDASGSVYLTGLTASDDFPVLNAFQPDPAGPSSPLNYPNLDAFVMKIGYRYVPVALPTQAPVRNYFTIDTPILTWTPITGATDYRVQVSKNKQFTGTPAFQGETTNGELSIMTTSLPNGMYYWHVQAQKPNGDWGGYGPVESFTIYTD